MRKKPHLLERMARCEDVWIQAPAAEKGRWRARYPEAKELRLELGCGKGKFTVETAALEPEVLLVALERVPDAMVIGMEAAHAAGLQNVLFAEADAAQLPDYLAPGEADCIYINFCDPWPSNQKRKRRLTHRDFLKKYQTVLKPGGRLLFRTDNVQLFQFTKLELCHEGWTLENVTTNRHRDGPQGVMTGYEEKFYASGIPICSLEAVPPAAEQTPEGKEVSV